MRIKIVIYINIFVQELRNHGSVTKRWLSSHGPACVQRATPGCAPRDDHTRPTAPPLLLARPVCIRLLGQEGTATLLLRFLRRIVRVQTLPRSHGPLLRCEDTSATVIPKKTRVQCCTHPRAGILACSPCWCALWHAPRCGSAPHALSLGTSSPATRARHGSRHPPPQ